MFHFGASTLTLFPTDYRSTGRWLSERSVNLDEVLPNPIKCHRPPKSNRMVNGLQMWRDGEGGSPERLLLTAAGTNGRSLLKKFASRSGRGPYLRQIPPRPTNRSGTRAPSSPNPNADHYT